MKEIRNELVRSVLEYLKPENIFDDLIKLEESNLTLGQQSFELNEFENIHLIAAGKAASYELKAIKDKLIKLGLGDKIIQSVAVTKIDHSVDDSSPAKARINSIFGIFAYSTEFFMTKRS